MKTGHFNLLTTAAAAQCSAPPADVLIRIKEQFQVSIDWLLTGDPESYGQTARR
jgi:hypothetical protein